MTVVANTSPTLDWSLYVDPAHFALERAACWQGAWHYVGVASELDQPGSQRAVRALDTPVLLVRDGSTLRAFVNACRHRGAELVAAHACAQSIRCPYHAWTYALDGALRAAPRFEQETGAAPSESGIALHPLRLEQWGPLCFVALDDDAPPLLEWLGPVPGAVAHAGIDVTSLELRHRTSGSTACNWKVACENYLECYHCRVAHPGFCGVVSTADDTYSLTTDRHVASQVAPRRDDVRIGEHGFDPAGPIDTGSFHYVFPNLMVNIAPGQPNLALGPVVPEAVDRTWRSLDYLAPVEVPDAHLESLIAWDDEVGAEDTVLVEAVQRGMAASSHVPRGVLMPSSEQLVGWFAERVRAATARS